MDVESVWDCVKVGCGGLGGPRTGLMSWRVKRAGVKGFVAVGGFSYGDGLGACEGWARTIRCNDQLADQFAAYFARPDTFALGVCNGCQMMAALAGMIPGAEHRQRFTRNPSEKYEARLSMVEIPDSPSLLMPGKTGVASCRERGYRYG